MWIYSAFGALVCTIYVLSIISPFLVCAFVDQDLRAWGSARSSGLRIKCIKTDHDVLWRIFWCSLHVTKVRYIGNLIDQLFTFNIIHHRIPAWIPDLPPTTQFSDTFLETVSVTLNSDNELCFNPRLRTYDVPRRTVTVLNLNKFMRPRTQEAALRAHSSSFDKSVLLFSLKQKIKAKEKTLLNCARYHKFVTTFGGNCGKHISVS